MGSRPAAPTYLHHYPVESVAVLETKAEVGLPGIHTMTVELDENCLRTLHKRLYGNPGKAKPSALSHLIEGFISNFVDLENGEPKTKAYEIGQRIGRKALEASDE